jgi:tryptophan synthase alpha chain
MSYNSSSHHAKYFGIWLGYVDLMTKRMNDTWQQLRETARTAIIPFVTIGFPSLEDTLSIIPAIEAAGADIIELGIPYSDPLADGPTIQAASFRAIQQGATTQTCLDTVKQLRRIGVSVPLVLMGYYNPIIAYGVERFAADCAKAEVDGCIIPDLPPEEQSAIRAAFKPVGISIINLLAPTSTNHRMALACGDSDGFIYCVSVAGVTGARENLPPGLPDFLDRVREYTSLPLVVGFGVSEKRHVVKIGKHAEGAVVGSALINVIDSSPPGERAERAAEFIARLVDSGDTTN